MSNQMISFETIIFKMYFFVSRFSNQYLFNLKDFFGTDGEAKANIFLTKTGKMWVDDVKVCPKAARKIIYLYL